jgi:methionyl aminopeptidase
MGIILKSEQEIARMKVTGRIVRAVLDAVEAACVPGVTTAELERIAAQELRRAGARSAFLGYRPGPMPPYPAVLCTSVNGVVVHGIPREDQVLAEGDLVGIDFACFKDGYCADAARTIAVGVISAPARDLLATTRECLELAISRCLPGLRLGDIGAAIEGHARSRGFSVVREMVGHGIGRAMHEPPNVPNYGRQGRGLRLLPGMVLAIEPMLNAGSEEIRVLDDGWTIVTEDASLSAHVEHTVAITAAGPQILTAG